MPERLVLHIGAMKTGTTYVQTLLRNHSEALRAAGHLDVRDVWQTPGTISRVLAHPKTPEAVAAWLAVTQSIRESDARTAVLSQEFLSFARPHQIEALLAPLSGIEIHVILVVRDQVGAIPSQWQTFARNYGDANWPDYLVQIDPARGGSQGAKAWRTYYRGQSIDRMVRDWSSHPRVDRFDLVVLPRGPGDNAASWRTFAALAGIDDVEVGHGTDSVNPSVGHASSQMLLDLGRHWQRAGRPVRVVRYALRPFINEILVPRRAHEGKARLDRAGWAFAAARNETHLAAIDEALAASALTVHGDLRDLVAAPPPLDLPDRGANPGRVHVHAAARALWEEAHRQIGRGRTPLTYQGTLRAITELIPHTESWAHAEVRLGARSPA